MLPNAGCPVYDVLRVYIPVMSSGVETRVVAFSIVRELTLFINITSIFHNLLTLFLIK